MTRRLALAVAFMAAVVPWAPPPAAAEPGLDEALAGFEETGAAQEDKAPSGLEDVLEGFEDTAPADAGKDETAPAYEKPSWWEITGALTASSSYNFAHKTPEPGETDWRGLSRMRGRMDLKLDADFAEGWKGRIGAVGYHDLAYALNGRGGYTAETLDEYESEARLKEAYVMGRLSSSLDIKVGRQIVVWGKSDNLRVTDVLNPMDNREPGMVDIEDIREPVTMTKLDYYTGPWNLSAIAIHEIRFNYNPPFGSDFYPAAAKLPEDTPRSTAGNTEYALALNGIFSGYDVSFYHARLYDDAPHMEMTGMTMTPAGPAPSLRLRHSRVAMYGMAANYAMGNFLIKFEGAYLDGIEYANAPGDGKARADVLLGVEYTGIAESALSAEIVDRMVIDHDPVLEGAPDYTEKHNYQTAFRYQADFRHDTVHVIALLSFLGLGGDKGGFQRVSVKYDVTDALSATAGMVLYQSGDSMFFKDVGDNDRIFAEVKYSF